MNVFFFSRIQLYYEPVLVDPVINGIQVIYFEDVESVSNDSGKGFTALQNEDIQEMKDVSMSIKLICIVKIFIQYTLSGLNNNKKMQFLKFSKSAKFTIFIGS